jgi:hypothetical protein
MGSIAGTLNSINSSLLSEISSFNASQGQPTTTTASTSLTASSDQVDVSQLSQLLKELRQLQQSNPTEFKQVLTDAAGKLKAAASQTTDTQQATFLNNLAQKFQTAANTGDPSAIMPSSSSTSGQGYNRHHHGIHGGMGLVSSILGSNSDPSGTSNASRIQSLLANVVGS